MDVVNKTNSESIQVNQLSTIGSHWEISLLQPIDTIFPSQSLIAGQAFSCFFVLKVGTRICIFRLSIFEIALPLPFDLLPHPFSQIKRIFLPIFYFLALLFSAKLDVLTANLYMDNISYYVLPMPCKFIFMAL
jgi:hypothetical protein